MNTDNVGFAGHLGGRCFVFHAQLRSTLRRKAATPGDYRHTERARARNHFLANLSNSNQPERAAKEPARFGKLFLVPLTAAQRNHVVRNMPVERENEGKCQFSDGYRILSGTVG